jgi:hypothetical protein
MQENRTYQEQHELSGERLQGEIRKASLGYKQYTIAYRYHLHLHLQHPRHHEETQEQEEHIRNNKYTLYNQLTILLMLTTRVIDRDTRVHITC